MVEFARESCSIMREIIPLATAHAKEMDYCVFDHAPLDLNETAYWAIENAGSLRVFTVRQDNQLVGYAVFIIAMALEHKTVKQAHEAGFYLAPEVRLGRTAVRFLSYCDSEMAEEQVAMVLYHSPVAHPKFGAILARRGYVKVDEVYARRL